jgi:hypothetical protein
MLSTGGEDCEFLTMGGVIETVCNSSMFKGVRLHDIQQHLMVVHLLFKRKSKI